MLGKMAFKNVSANGKYSALMYQSIFDHKTLDFQSAQVDKWVNFLLEFSFTWSKQSNQTVQEGASTQINECVSGNEYTVSNEKDLEMSLTLFGSTVGTNSYSTLI